MGSLVTLLCAAYAAPVQAHKSRMDDHNRIVEIVCQPPGQPKISDTEIQYNPFTDAPLRIESAFYTNYGGEKGQTKLGISSTQNITFDTAGNLVLEIYGNGNSVIDYGCNTKGFCLGQKKKPERIEKIIKRYPEPFLGLYHASSNNLRKRARGIFAGIKRSGIPLQLEQYHKKDRKK